MSARTMAGLWHTTRKASSRKQSLTHRPTPMTVESGKETPGRRPDAGGNIFVATGNGAFDAGKGGRDYGDSLLKLNGETLKLSGLLRT